MGKDNSIKDNIIYHFCGAELFFALIAAENVQFTSETVGVKHTKEIE